MRRSMFAKFARAKHVNESTIGISHIDFIKKITNIFRQVSRIFPESKHLISMPKKYSGDPNLLRANLACRESMRL